MRATTGFGIFALLPLQNKRLTLSSSATPALLAASVCNCLDDLSLRNIKAYFR
jgi:hypothetical protein